MQALKVKYTAKVEIETLVYAKKDDEDAIFYEECENNFPFAADIKEIDPDSIDIDWDSIEEVEAGRWANGLYKFS